MNDHELAAGIDEVPDLRQDVVEHLLGQAAGEGVLLADVVSADQGHRAP